jgi:hypothetical protein
MVLRSASDGGVSKVRSTMMTGMSASLGLKKDGHLLARQRLNERWKPPVEA